MPQQDTKKPAQDKSKDPVKNPADKTKTDDKKSVSKNK